MTTAATLRKRNLTAALRSLKLIRDAVLTHLDILEGGGVPESSFTASVTKYEAARLTLGVLDAAIGENGSPEEDEDICVSRDGLIALIELLRASEMGYVIHDAEEGSPLDVIVAAVGTGEPAGQS